MTTRIIETTKNKDQQKEDLEKLKLMLIKSKYPRDKIQKSIQDILRSIINDNNINNNQIPTTNKKEKEGKFLYSITLPYIPRIEILKRNLKKLNVKLYSSYPNKMNSLFNNNIKPTSKSIIYQIECNCSAIYNGETKVRLINRIKQHEKVINKNDDKQNSKIVQHHINKLHQCRFNTNTAFIIDNEIDFKKRRIKESIYSIINDSINRHDQLDERW
ncbi:unnamed protein product [Rotaria sordida]|uniref:GIY-YIG domain-containing protein n=1 Tax=Rotaria sordida TaxID=392033 RepID=A0A814Q627_9BILA|nr:unnamed protein product [Rotaria sordida]CAF1090722.1 unnamed protein product [Rotaria sordida]CAF1115980.1 unnamed protein product [Rotaria sordida]CAF3750673.1 unnamed protein product [Rotaria sordida]CAF3959058.1 unnamed protein product [Rotaria sordida]